jgi:hypothetical protein
VAELTLAEEGRTARGRAEQLAGATAERLFSASPLPSWTHLRRYSISSLAQGSV